MNYQKIYRYLVVLLPLVYIAHNAEEWFMMIKNADEISGKVPKFLSNYLKLGENSLIDLFRISIIVASVLPFLVVPYLLGGFTPTRVRVTLVIVFATLLNAVSHISTSFFLGMISPGLFSSLIILFPYSVFFILILTRMVKISRSSYILLGTLAVLLYFFAIAISWLMGILLV